MARALQSAILSFGLVHIPVKLYTAAHSKAVTFHLLHAKDGSRIHEQLICQSEGKPISRNELVKGYEVTKGRYIEITNDELDALEAEANRNVEIQEFVPVNTVDPVYFAKTYYLGPDKGGDKPYRLLARAMHREAQAAIAQFVQRGKEEIVMIRPIGDGQLVLHVLYYADEVRAFEALPPERDAIDRELQLATELIRQLQKKKWDPTHYRDSYRERVLALIKKKQAGEKIIPPKPSRTQDNVVDLMTALKQSLANRGHAPRSSERRTKRGVKMSKRSRKAA